MLADTLNAVRWLGKHHRGFYEVWYLTAVDPTSGDAYWFRYTIDSPVEGKGDIEAGTWAIVTPKAEPKAGPALHDRLPISKFADKTTDEKGFRFELGKWFLERGRATGKVGTGERAVEWDLKWTPNGIGFEHVSPTLESLGIAKSAVNSAHLAIEVEGTIKLGSKVVKVAKWPAHQSHTWGRRHADRWAWAHCNAFAEDSEAVFEGVSARVRKLGFLLPPATPIYFRVGADEHEWSSVGAIWSNASRIARGRWELEAESDTTLIKGTITAPPERTIAVEYRDPDGSLLYCNHATGADLSLEVFTRRGMRWELERKLTSSGTTAFEICSREREEGAGRSLDLVEARVFEEEPAPAPKPAAPKAMAAAPKT